MGGVLCYEDIISYRSKYYRSEEDPVNGNWYLKTFTVIPGVTLIKMKNYITQTIRNQELSLVEDDGANIVSERSEPKILNFNAELKIFEERILKQKIIDFTDFHVVCLIFNFIYEKKVKKEEGESVKVKNVTTIEIMGYLGNKENTPKIVLYDSMKDELEIKDTNIRKLEEDIIFESN